MKIFKFRRKKPKTPTEIAHELAEQAYKEHGRDQKQAEKFILTNLSSETYLKEIIESVATILYLKKVSGEIVSSIENSMSGRQSE